MRDDTFINRRRSEFLKRISVAIDNIKSLIELVSDDVSEEVKNQKEQNQRHQHPSKMH